MQRYRTSSLALKTASWTTCARQTTFLSKASLHR
nr:MAG TPA: hypothetical protein [Caudoviricetes sp.]